MSKRADNIAMAQNTVFNYANEWFGVTHIVESAIVDSKEGDDYSEMSSCVLEELFSVQDKMDNIVELMGKLKKLKE